MEVTLTTQLTDYMKAHFEGTGIASTTGRIKVEPPTYGRLAQMLEDVAGFALAGGQVVNMVEPSTPLPPNMRVTVCAPK